MRSLSFALAAALALAATAHAATLEGVKAQPFAQTAAVAHFSRRPMTGTVTGGLGGAPIELTLNRRAWTITGGANGAPVQISIDHDAKRITGGAGGRPVELTFDWSPEKVTYNGPAGYTVDWQAGTLQGEGVDLTFDLRAGTASGGAWGYPVELKLDAVSGRLTGGMNGAPVDAVLVNMDLSDLLQYFFVLRK
jgi:hypothetical protein